jgi:ketosteroid isomerase-like protein
MSQENVEIVGRIYEAFQSGDLDRVTQLVSPDIELRGTIGGLSEGSVARGIAAVREMFEGWDEEVWEEIRLSPQEFIDAGEVESETAVLFELRDGKVTRIQGFMDQEQALEAAGLRE